MHFQHAQLSQTYCLPPKVKRSPFAVESKAPPPIKVGRTNWRAYHSMFRLNVSEIFGSVRDKGGKI